MTRSSVTMYLHIEREQLSKILLGDLPVELKNSGMRLEGKLVGTNKGNATTPVDDSIGCVYWVTKSEIDHTNGIYKIKCLFKDKRWGLDGEAVLTVTIDRLQDEPKFYTFFGEIKLRPDGNKEFLDFARKMGIEF